MVLLATPLFAQTPSDDDDNQSWNDVQVAVPVNEKVDLQFTGTIRIGKNISRFNEGRLGAGVNWKVRKDVTLSTLYQNIRALNSSGQWQTENRFDVRATYKFPVKTFGLSHRSMVEYRIRGSGNTWRYRPSITFDKEIKFTPGAKFFVTEEVFYDSANKKFSRNRFSTGINKTLNKNLSLDIYYLRQNDGFSRPGDLNIIGTTWKIKF